MEAGKGTSISYDEVPITQFLREALPKFAGEKAKGLNCLANYYYDVSKCGVGFHGDENSSRVIGIRLGASIPLHYQWFFKSKGIGSRFKIMLNDGDLYIMS